jgi:hypothetical protein
VVSQFRSVLTRIRAIAGKASPDILGVIAALGPLVDQLRTLFAREIEDALAPAKDYVVDTYAGKQEVASSLNELLDCFKLAVLCPNTARPARTYVRSGTGSKKEGQYQLDTAERPGTASSKTTLPSLLLTLAEPRRRRKSKRRKSKRRPSKEGPATM